MPTLDMPKRHALELKDVDPRHLHSVLLAIFDRAQNFDAPNRPTRTAPGNSIRFTARDRQNLFVATVAAQRVVVAVA